VIAPAASAVPPAAGQTEAASRDGSTGRALTDSAIPARNDGFF